MMGPLQLRSGPLRVLAMAALLVAGSVLVTEVGRVAGLPIVEAEPEAFVVGLGDVGPGDEEEQAPAETANRLQPNILRDPPGYTRIARPVLQANEPRRIGIQAGHWLAGQAPPELSVLVTQTGTSWAGVYEWEINLDIAQRVASILRPQGYVVDVLPTTIPRGYLADAFVSLHGDGDGTGAKSGYKLAHGSRRGPYEDALMRAIIDAYGPATGLAYDQAGVSRNMLNYYAFNWRRYQHSAAPHTPAVIVEMGFVSNANDRHLMTARADLVAQTIADGILAFLEAHPRETIFGQDLLIPPFRRGTPAPSVP